MKELLRKMLLETKTIIKRNDNLKWKWFEVQTLDQNQFKTDWVRYSIYLTKNNNEYMRVWDLDDLIGFLKNYSKNIVRVVFYSEGTIEKDIITNKNDLSNILMDILEEELS